MIVLDLPAPLSVNRTRKIDWASKPARDAWTQAAHALTMVAWARGKRPKTIYGQFEAIITLREDCRIDGDNAVKQVIDYARRLSLIVDDSPKYLRRLVVVFGEAPEGCRLILRPMKEKP